MSLSYASDTSMMKIMKCLDNKSDRTTLSNLMRCSYKVNNVAGENGFSKITEATARIYSENASVQNVEFSFNWDNYKTRRHTRFANPNNHSKSFENALLYLQSKTKTIKDLRIYYSTLDADILEVFKNNANFIRTIKHLTLWEIRIEWTSDQFLQFIKLFDNLQTLAVNDRFKESVKFTITNEILSLVKTSVEIEKSSFRRERILFPLISSSIFDFWLNEKTLKFLRFEGISTEISFSSARRMIEHLIVTNNPECDRTINFGTLKYSSDFHRELALFQKDRGFKVYIYRAKRLCDVVITYEKSERQFTFEVVCPIEMSFFETMMDDLHKLRVACEPFQNADLEIRRPFIEIFREHVENLQLYYYQFTDIIIGTATVQGFENEMIQEINTLEEEIQVIIEKLKAEGMESDNLAEN